MVLGICIRLKIPSCILAPPAAEKRTNGRFNSTARSAAVIIALPTYMPIDPPINEKSWAAATIGVLPISPSATNIASFSELFFCAAFIRSGYFFWSLNCNGSVIGFGTSISTKTPPSNRFLKRSRGVIGI